MENGTGRRINVVVTGFGPFRDFHCNPSWEVVQHLKKAGIREDVNLVTKQIPVDYDVVQAEIRNLWQDYNPELVVHCGASGIAKELTLEQLAHNVGYESADINGKLPPNNCCKCDGPEVIRAGIEMRKVCAAVNNSACCVKAVVSEDAGR